MEKGLRRKILVIGASRGIGLETVRTALRAGRSVRAVARSAVRIPIEDAALDNMSGDALDRDTSGTHSKTLT